MSYDFTVPGGPSSVLITKIVKVQLFSIRERAFLNILRTIQFQSVILRSQVLERAMEVGAPIIGFNHSGSCIQKGVESLKRKKRTNQHCNPSVKACL